MINKYIYLYKKIFNILKDWYVVMLIEWNILFGLVFILLNCFLNMGIIWDGKYFLDWFYDF